MTAVDLMSVRQVIYGYQRRPFRYGGDDCCSFVGQCLEAAGRGNPMRLFAYDNEEEAEEIIAQYGSLTAAITATLGDPMGNPLKAVENDVVVCTQGKQEIAGIVHNTGLGLRCVLRTKSGVVDWPLCRASAAWSTADG
jgi:hypothetical protein